jgi:hypothetical protein
MAPSEVERRTLQRTLHTARLQNKSICTDNQVLREQIRLVNARLVHLHETNEAQQVYMAQEAECMKIELGTKV